MSSSNSPIPPFKRGGISPINPSPETLDLLRQMDALRDQNARAAGVPRGDTPGIVGAGTASQHAAMGQAMDRAARHEARTMESMDRLNSNIERLCHLLETLQLSVLPRDN